MNTTRCRQLNTRPSVPGDSVVYIMSRDQRVHDNFALLAAQDYAIARKLPLIVFFNLYVTRGVRAMQHYDFMLAGLQEVARELETYRIPFIIQVGDSIDNIKNLQHKIHASALFFDFSPLRESQSTKKSIADVLAIPCFEVDTHNIIPAWITSAKEEWAAYTIRPKIHALLPAYLQEPPALVTHPFSGIHQPTIDWDVLRNAIQAHALPAYTISFLPGEKVAKKIVDAFLENKLVRYQTRRNDPTSDAQSNLSPYLHFGHISSLRVALAVAEYAKTHPESKVSADAFLEELIVRKELSDNFCLYNSNYDTFAGIREWAKKTLEKHSHDVRQRVYTYDAFAQGKTYDSAWNAAQKQLVTTGKMHGYMRMYWAKKILEWTKDPQEAIAIAVRLNDTYHLDGYDPNGYVGILWSIGGVHDRPWFEREIFGTIRYMNFNGLKKKFDLEKYISLFT